MGTRGGPLGTERSSALPPHASGELFAREVERANERARGTGAAERHLDDLEETRRETRRAGFERERPTDEARGDPRASEANFRSEQGPVAPQPAQAQPRPEMANPAESNCAPPFVDGACASEPAGQPTAEPTAPQAPAAAATVLTAVPAAASAPAIPPGADASREAPAAPTANEPEPVELGQMLRASAFKGAKPAPSASASNAPNAAVLESAAEILRQIELHATPGVRRLTLELEPADLGRLSVQLALRAGKVTGIVRAENAATLDALARHEDELVNVLAKRGVQADSLRFELGFGSRSRGYERARAAADESPAPRNARESVAPAQTLSAKTTPRAEGARLDTLA